MTRSTNGSLGTASCCILFLISLPVPLSQIDHHHRRLHVFVSLALSSAPLSFTLHATWFRECFRLWFQLTLTDFTVNSDPKPENCAKKCATTTGCWSDQWDHRHFTDEKCDGLSPTPAPTPRPALVDNSPLIVGSHPINKPHTLISMELKFRGQSFMSWNYSVRQQYTYRPSSISNCIC